MKEPNIRFQEFNDEWEVQSFGSYVKECNELTSDKVKYPLYSLTIEEGVVPKPERYEREHLITKEGDSYKIVPPNAFVYNPMNLRFGALKVNHEDFPVCVSGYYDVFFMGDEENLKFWENYLLTDRMLNYYYSIATGSLIEKLRVHFSQFVNIKKPLPSLAEQKKMSSLFKNIDDVISAIESEVALWDEKKKGVMQKIFSQEVRFRKEDGSEYPDWKNGKLSDLCTYHQGLTYSPLDVSDDGVIVLRSSNIQADVICYDDIVRVNLELKEYLLVSENDIFICVRNGSKQLVGKTAIIKEKDLGCSWGAFMMIIRSKQENNFVYQYLKTELFKKEMFKDISTATISQITKGMLDACRLFYPCVDEQNKIADVLSAMDEAIQLKKQKLIIWKNIKKGLLQQMFV